MSDKILRGHLNHILLVLQERVSLYSKRQLETKRAIKAINRCETYPDTRMMYIMLDAHINYIVNNIGIQSIKELMNSKQIISSNIESIFLLSSDLFQIFKNALINSDSLPIDNTPTQLFHFLFTVVFSDSEKIQRKNIIKYLMNTNETLIQEIFKQIVILDKEYTKNTINQFRKYIEEFMENSV